MQIPSRRNRSVARFNCAGGAAVTTAEVEPGDGFLFRQRLDRSVGWMAMGCASCTPDRARIGLTAPHVPLNARYPRTQMQLRIQPNVLTDCFALTDHHVGDLGHHTPIPPLDAADPENCLLVRRTPYGAPETVPREHWCFAASADGAPGADNGYIWLDGGFRPGLIYDLLYYTARLPDCGRRYVGDARCRVLPSL